MSAETFIDTNVLIYAHDADAGDKRRRASEILRELWETRRGALSVQVLKEFYVNVTRKIPRPLAMAVARDIVKRYGVWTLVETDHRLVMDAIDLARSVRLSFWDAMIVAAAQRSGSGRLLTEDLNDGQRIGSITVENPFIR